MDNIVRLVSKSAHTSIIITGFLMLKEQSKIDFCFEERLGLWIDCPYEHIVEAEIHGMTTLDRRPPRGQLIFNMHWARAFSPSVPKDDAPRRRVTVRISNMNPKNIGSYMEEEGEGRRKGNECNPSAKTKKERKSVVGRRKELNEKLMRFWRLGR